MKPRLYLRAGLKAAGYDRLLEAFDVITLAGEVRPAALAGACPAARAIWTFGERVDAELLDALPELAVIANQGVGTNTIDREELERRGIDLIVPRGANADAVADHAIGLLLALRHRIVEGDRYVRQGLWAGRHGDEPMGEDLTGTTLGIVGLGAIGSATARRAVAFGIDVICTSRTAKPEAPYEQVVLDELLIRSDAISLHCPLTPATRGLIGARELALMRPSAVLVNTARGAICDEAALTAALAAGRLHGAALDVTIDEPDVPAALLAHPRVIITPHIADYQPGAIAALTRGCVDGLLAWGAGCSR